jgi:hypothetical protein
MAAPLQENGKNRGTDEGSDDTNGKFGLIRRTGK